MTHLYLIRHADYTYELDGDHWHKSDDIWILERSNDYSHLNTSGD